MFTKLMGKQEDWWEHYANYEAECKAAIACESERKRRSKGRTALGVLLWVTAMAVMLGAILAMLTVVLLPVGVVLACISAWLGLKALACFGMDVV